MTKVLIFDMDGTLTPPTQPISEDMMKALNAISPGYKKYLVTGSDMDKIERQIPEDFLLKTFEKVFSCNGTRVWNCNLDMDDETRGHEPDLIHRVDLLDRYSQADINHLISSLLKVASESHTKFKTGTFVEWRESQINFSVVGRNCSLGQREDYIKWDMKSGERKRIVEGLSQEFQGWGLAFNLGGQISIEITRKEWNKTYALRNIKESPEDCIFFGDKVILGGNDYDIAMMCGKYHGVDGPKDTLGILNQYRK